MFHSHYVVPVSSQRLRRRPNIITTQSQGIALLQSDYHVSQYPSQVRNMKSPLYLLRWGAMKKDLAWFRNSWKNTPTCFLHLPDLLGPGCSTELNVWGVCSSFCHLLHFKFTAHMHCVNEFIIPVLLFSRYSSIIMGEITNSTRRCSMGSLLITIVWIIDRDYLIWNLSMKYHYILITI